MSGEKTIVIDSDTESGEDDIRRAIELSLQDIATEQRAAGRENARSREASGNTPATTLAALDRKKMEQERLERQKKRAREENDTQNEPNKKRSTGDVTVTSPNPKPPELKFPKPVVKRTWAFGQSRTGEDIKIEEILQKSDLQLAILSSFVWDESWLLSKIDIQKTKLMLVAYAPDNATVSIPVAHETETVLTTRKERVDEIECPAKRAILLPSNVWTRCHALQTASVEILELFEDSHPHRKFNVIRLG